MKGKCKLQVIRNNEVIQEIEQENTITNALTKLFNPNLYDYLANVSSASLNTYKCYTPINQKALGGLLLFNDDRDNSVNHIYPTSEDITKYVGCCGAVPFTSRSSKIKGGLNTTESGPVQDGYKFVWDINPQTQAYDVKSLSLTSAAGGSCGLDCDLTNDSLVLDAVAGYCFDDLNVLKKIPCGVGKSTFSNIPAISRSQMGSIVKISSDYKTFWLAKKSGDVLIINEYHYNPYIDVTKAYSNDITATSDSDFVGWEMVGTHTIQQPVRIPGEGGSLDILYNFCNDYFLVVDGDYLYSRDYRLDPNRIRIYTDVIKIDLRTYQVDRVHTLELDTAGSVTTAYFSHLNFYTISNYVLLFDTYEKKLHLFDKSTMNYIRSISVSYNTSSIVDKWSAIEINQNIVLFIGLIGNTTTGYSMLVDLSTKTFTDLKTCFETQSLGNLRIIKLVDNTYNSLLLTCRCGSDTRDTIAFLFLTFYFASICNLDTLVSVGVNDALKIEYTITNTNPQ